MRCCVSISADASLMQCRMAWRRLCGSALAAKYRLQLPAFAGSQQFVKIA